MPYHQIASGLLHLDAEITYENTVDFLTTLRQMETDPDVKQIKVFVTSHGGALMPTVAIVQSLLTSEKNVKTLGTGYIASAALPVLAAGTKGHREIVEGTKILLHQPTNMLAETSRKSPNIETWKHEVCFLESIMDQYYWALEKCSRKTAAFWKNLLVNTPSRFVSEDEALEWGLIDTVVALPCAKHIC